MSDAYPRDPIWTPTARAEFAREPVPYTTCLSDAEWAVLAPLLPASARSGRPWLWSQHALLDGVLYVQQRGFAVQLRRWVIERTLVWISRCRMLARDHEATVSSVLAFFVLAAAIIPVR